MPAAEPPRVRFSDRVGRSELPELETLDLDRLESLVARAWRLQQGPAGVLVEVVWMQGEEHNRLHARFLDDPSPTDVITFPYGDEDLFGEIVVNLDMALEQAHARGSTMQQEVALYVVHGALHLLGLDDATSGQKAVMRAAETAVLDQD